MLCLIFDLDDTLYNQIEPFSSAWYKNFEFSDDLIEPVYIQSRIFSEQVFHLSESGAMSMSDMHSYRIQKAFETFNIRISKEKAEKFQSDYCFFQTQIQLIPEVKNVLIRCLDLGIKLGVITNGPSQHQRTKIKNLGLEQWIPSEYMFISSEVGYAKPDTRLFRYVEQKMHLQREKTYYIGDSFQNDVMGAKNAGWHTVWVKRRTIIEPDQLKPYDYLIDENFSFLDFISTVV